VVSSHIYRQNHGPTFESDYSRQPQNSSCRTFRTLVGRGHMLWIDSFFNSPKLARKLKIKDSTDCVGTLKLNRKNVPKEVKEKKLKKEEIRARHSGPVKVLKWRDKINVTGVSTYHSAESQRVSNKGKDTGAFVHDLL